MANFVDLTEEYMTIRMSFTYRTRQIKPSEYDYAKKIGPSAEKYRALNFHNAYNYVWSSEDLCRDFYDKDFKLVGKVYYQAIAGKDPRVLFPFKIEYYENEELIEYLLLDYDEFERLCFPGEYFSRSDRVKDPDYFPYITSLIPVLKEWFDDTVFEIQRD